VVVVVELEIMATRSSRRGTRAGTKASEASASVTSTVAPVGSLRVSTRQQSKGNNKKSSIVDEINHNRSSGSEWDQGNILSQYSQLIEDKDVDMVMFFVLREGKTAATCESTLASTFLVRLDYDKEMK
jgi:hypothetical protein